MKGFFLLGVIAISIYQTSALVRFHEDYDSRINRVGDKCRKQFKVSDDEYMKLMKNDTIPESETGYCLVSCFMKELGYYHFKMLDVDAMKESMKMRYSDEESIKKAKDILDKCKEKVVANENECTLNAKYVKCFMEMTNKEGLKM